MRRVTFKTLQERQNNSGYQELPKLKDILVDLSVRTTPKVVRELRLVGHKMQFTEYNNKKRIALLTEEERELYLDKKQQNLYKDLNSLDKNDPIRKEAWQKSVEVPFMDVDQNKNFTRIGHDDPDQCPWKAANYIGTRKYVQNCLEKTSDGWVPKILCKGSSIFDPFAKWEGQRFEEHEDDENISWFLGSTSAPMVKITATYDKSKLGDVDYEVFITSKDLKLTEDMINLLRAVREPSADELNRLRKEYNIDREEDSSLPEWEDYFEYSYDIRRIFQYTPPKINSNSSSVNENTEEDLEQDNTDENEESSIEIGEINW